MFSNCEIHDKNIADVVFVVMAPLKSYDDF